MLPILRRCFFGVICFQAQGPAFAQGQNQLAKHLVESKRMQIKMLSGIGAIEAHLRKVQPSIDVNNGGPDTFSRELLE